MTLSTRILGSRCPPSRAAAAGRCQNRPLLREARRRRDEELGQAVGTAKDLHRVEPASACLDGSQRVVPLWDGRPTELPRRRGGSTRSRAVSAGERSGGRRRARGRARGRRRRELEKGLRVPAATDDECPPNVDEDAAAPVPRGEERREPAAPVHSLVRSEKQRGQSRWGSLACGCAVPEEAMRAARTEHLHKRVVAHWYGGVVACGAVERDATWARELELGLPACVAGAILAHGGSGRSSGGSAHVKDLVLHGVEAVLVP